MNSERTHNQALRSLISLEKRLTPEERVLVIDLVASVFRRLNRRSKLELDLLDHLAQKEEFDLSRFGVFGRAHRLSALRHWAAQLSGHASLAGNEPPQQWRRAWSRGGKILFRRGPGRSSTILVCFTDGTGRVMMSVADFLEAWKVADSDVLVLWPRTGGKFKAGISGCGADLEQGVLGAGRLVDSLGYSTVFVMGTSSGATPALLYGLLHNPNHVLLVGPPAEALQLLNQRSRTQRIDTGSEEKFESRQVSVVFGESSAIDRAVAKQFSHKWKCEIFAVPKSNHVCLYTLLERSLLSEFFVNVFQKSGG
jgi:hypothetical protein